MSILAIYLERIEPDWQVYINELKRQGLPIPPNNHSVQDDKSYNQFREKANKILAQIKG